MLRARIVTEPLQTSTGIVLGGLFLIGMLTVWARFLDLSTLRQARQESLLGRLQDLRFQEDCSQVESWEFFQSSQLWCRGNTASHLPFLHPSRLFGLRTLDAAGSWITQNPDRIPPVETMRWIAAKDTNGQRWLGLEVREAENHFLVACVEDWDIRISDAFWLAVLLGLPVLFIGYQMTTRPRLAQFFEDFRVQIQMGTDPVRLIQDLKQWPVLLRLPCGLLTAIAVLTLIKCLTNPHLNGHLLIWLQAVSAFAMIVLPIRLLPSHGLCQDLLYLQDTSSAKPRVLQYPETQAILNLRNQAQQVEQLLHRRLESYQELLKALQGDDRQQTLQCLDRVLMECCHVRINPGSELEQPEISGLANLINPEVLDHLLGLIRTWVQSRS